MSMNMPPDPRQLPQGQPASEPRVKPIADLSVKLYADGASLADMLALGRKPFISGFTTNPTLMRKAGVQDYRRFAEEVLAAIPDRPISFEVISDDLAEMERQARAIATWGRSVFVKIPITNTRGEPCYDVIHRLSHDGVAVNVTAVLTLEQVERAARALRGGSRSNVSIFAGRIADTGRDPVPIVADALRMLSGAQIELIWASPRELLNVFQADQVGCHIITLTVDLVAKLDLVGKDLAAFSLDTVKMFREDAVKAGFTLAEVETGTIVGKKQ
jgi:transaldolase